jgi:hypothetical protein
MYNAPLMQLLKFCLDYLWIIFTSWLGITVLVLGALQLGEWLAGKSAPIPRWIRVTVCVVLLFLTQAIAYKKLMDRPLPQPAPIIVQEPPTESEPTKKPQPNKPAPTKSTNQTQSGGKDNSQTGQVTQGPCSNLQVGGSNNVGAPCSNNTFLGNPDPLFSWGQVVLPVNSIKQVWTEVQIHVQGVMERPAFAATCDRPCETASGIVVGQSQTASLTSPGNENIAALAIFSPPSITPNLEVCWSIRAKDNSIVHINKVERLPADKILSSDSMPVGTIVQNSCQGPPASKN